ncbi:MAG: GntR family transcriptional regulator [Victivallales bacterium]|nr:GntR family transcriptional regulator [Victivallales bacterium]
MNKDSQPFRYRVLKDYVLQKISSGEFAGGTKFTSENQLCAQFGLSRCTVRQALKELENEGYLYRIQGKGTFVRDASPATSRKIALLIYDTLYLTHSISANLILGIDAVLKAQGYALDILASRRSFQDERVSQMTGAYAGFLIGAYQIDPLIVKALEHSSRPFLFVKNYLEEYKEKAMRIDYEKAGFLGAEHLIKKGCEKLGLVYAGDMILISRDFGNGVKQACLEYGASLKKANIVECSFAKPEDAAVAAELFAASRPDGIVCSTDEFAAVICEELLQHGIDIPGQMLLVGCNNSIISQVNVPQLTTLDIPTFTLGQAAAKCLLAEIDGKLKEPPALIEPALIERASTKRNTAMV